MTTFLQRLDAVIAERHLLKHPFYQAWNDGTLTKAMLQEYAAEYYLQVRDFPRYVSATHAACDDMDVRQMLLENLIEEEHGPQNHPELWLRFADALGLERDAVRGRDYHAKTRASNQVYLDLTRKGDVVDGMAALYAYESQIPEVAGTKIDGLDKHYDMNDARAISFFTVHQTADEIHSKVTREALDKLCDTPEKQAQALASAEQAADALNLLLDGVWETHCQAAHC